MPRRWWMPAVVIIFALIITLPFVNQAFHIDDDIFWNFARERLESPLSQDLPEFQLTGKAYTRWRDTHPPVDSLYMSLIMRVTGSEAEAPLHAGFIFFPVVAGVSMYFLGRRFTRHPLVAALLLLSTPTVMVLSHTLMADVPLMAAWLAATALYIYGVDRDDGRLLALAGVAAALSMLTGYQALALFILLPAYPAIRGRLSLKNLAPLIIPLTVFGLYTLESLVRYGGLPRFSHAGGTSRESGPLLDRIEGMLLHTGGLTIFPLAMAAIFSLRRRRYLALPLVAVAALALGLYQRGAEGLGSASTLIYVVLMTAGLMLLVGVISEMVIQWRHARDGRPVDTGFLYLASWLLLMMPAIIFLLPHITAKYMLAFAAPVVLIALGELERGLPRRTWREGAIALTLVLTLAAGFALSAADYRLAASYRDFTFSVEERYHPQGTVWFVGEWGFRHYMEEEGYRYLTSDDASPRAGDLIISPTVADWPLEPSVAERLEPVETVAAEWRWPLRVMSVEANAGFYGTYWGLLPFTVADVPVEAFTVMRVGDAASVSQAGGR